MSLQDRLMKLAQYNVDFKFYDEWVLIGIQYEKGWHILKPTNSLIEHLSKNNKYYYCAPLKEVSVDEVFDCITETIEYNKDLEKKVELFQEKVNELQNIFSTEDYETLLTLSFKMKKRKKKIKVDEKEIKDNLYEDVNELYDEGVQFVDTLNEIDKENNENNFIETSE